MFLHFLSTELRNGLKQPMVWIFMAVVSLMVFGAVSSDSIVIGQTVGNVHRNAPHTMTFYTLIMTLLCLLVATAFFNNAALREHNYNFHEILYTAPLGKTSYFFGRFFGALILSCLPLLGIWIGMALSTGIAPAAGWLEADRFGPVPTAAFFNSFLLFVVPNMLFAGAIIFALATRFRSTVISFIGAVVIIILYFISGTFLSDIDSETTGALFDSFGIRAYSLTAKYYTPAEKNTLVPALSGLLLYNRLIWTGIGLAILGFSFSTFSFRTRFRKASKKAKKAMDKVRSETALPSLSRAFGGVQHWSIFRSFFSTDLRSMIKSPVFFILVFFSLLLYIISLIQGFEYFGLQSYPVTYEVMESIGNSSGLFVIIILVFFSGELVWRSRLSHIHEVIDATPHASWLPMLGHVFSLTVLASILHLSLIGIGMIYQLLNGFTAIEPGVYLGSFLLDELPKFLIWSGILVFLQVLINNRYLAYFVSILLFLFLDLVFLMIDVNSNMVMLGSIPSMPYSDMNGFGDAMPATLWFSAYWVLFAAVCVNLGALLWKRGYRDGFSAAMQDAKKRFRGAQATIAISVGALWILTAGFVFYNTQILNPYATSDEREELQVSYEKDLGKYRNTPAPKITATVYHIDIFPEDRDIKVQAEITLLNDSDAPIDSLIFSMNEDWNQVLDIEGGELVFQYDHDLLRIYTLSQPLLPGASMTINMDAGYITEGFENALSEQYIASNGTFINNIDFLPWPGYNDRYEIGDKNDRKKFGLPRRARSPKLEIPCGKGCDINYLTNGTADWVDVETYISTSGDQLAIAPGSLMREWQEDGRNHYHYKLDHSAQNFLSFMSADYQVARRDWKGINLEVYYNAKHTYNIEMMLDAIQRSLEYYTTNFGPYYHNQARIIEFPRYSNFAQAFPGTMPYSESFGFITDLRDENDNNVVDAVIAHEMAHQWWAHQEMSAKMQGGTMLTESLAEYSSLMVMKSVSSPMKMRKFLKYDHDRYLRGRSREADAERPLYKVENQQHIHYGKGSVVLYGIQEYIGEDVMNEAIRAFLDSSRYEGPPYTTSMDLIHELNARIPDSLSYLVDDWIKDITLYDLRLKEATATELDNGRYQVTMQVEARKLKADSLGNETEVAMKEWIPIGLFADEDEEELMSEQMALFSGGKLTFELEADKLPVKAAIDPRHLLIDRAFDDNIRSVSVEN